MLGFKRCDIKSGESSNYSEQDQEPLIAFEVSQRDSLMNDKSCPSEHLLPAVITHAAEGNTAFSSTNFEEALRCYTEALAVLKDVGAPRDPIILLNRSAAFIGLKRCGNL